MCLSDLSQQKVVTNEMGHPVMEALFLEQHANFIKTALEHRFLGRINEHTNRAYVDEYDVSRLHYPLPIVSSCILILAHLDNSWPLPLT